MLKRLIGGFVPSYKDKQGLEVPDSVSTLEKLNLGGVDQWITIRGKNRDLPLLLFLHGGPGSPQTGAQMKYNSLLEEHFLVVNWDQRGSGKSYSSNIKPESMNINQLLNDAHELVVYLLSRFERKKLFLMGHSVGAAYGLLFTQKYPEQIYAYVGINQPIHRQEEEKRSYRFALEAAQRNKNTKAIKELEEIGYPTNGVYRKIEDMVVQRKWLTKFKGVTYKKSGALINLSYMLSSHLTFKEKTTFMKGFGFSSTNLWDEVTSLDFFKLVPEVKVPVFLIAGSYDRIVFPELVEDYYEYVNANYKKLILFEESGHMACFEEPEKFNNLLIHEVLPLMDLQTERRLKTANDQ